MPHDYTPRLSIEIDEETYWRMKNLIPWGLTSKVMNILLSDLLDLVESHGNIVIAAIINRSLSAQNVVKDFRGKEMNKNGTIGYKKEPNPDDG